MKRNFEHEDIDETNTHGTYGATLFDARWKSKRQHILDRDQNRCVNCQGTETLQVHHRQYHFSQSLNSFLNPWEYKDELLITLCKRCHQTGHRQYKVPTKYIK